MLNLGDNRRRRLSGIFANSAQVMLGAIFISNFFKEGGKEIQIASVLVLVGCYLFAFFLEPETKGDEP